MTDGTSRDAARRVVKVERTLSTGALHLACHAALPVAINPDLFHLLRVNFFLDPPEELPYAVEAKLLLSPLFREVDDGLYDIDREVRDLLLLMLEQRYGSGRIRQVAALLAQYTERSGAWSDRPELERAQQLTALNFLDPGRAARWLEQAEHSSGNENFRAEWFIAMKRRMERSPASSLLFDERLGSAREQLESDAQSLGAILQGIRTLEELAQYRDADKAVIVDLLVGYVRRRAPWPPTRAPDGTLPPPPAGTPDMQAALTALGRIQHDAASRPRLQLDNVDLRAADLSRADLAQANLNKTGLQGANLSQTNLTRAFLYAADLTNAALPQASLADANLDRTDLTLADLSFADLHDAQLQEARLQGTNLTNADLSGARLGGSDFRTAKLDKIRLRSALADSKTRWPSGFDWRGRGVLTRERSAASPEPTEVDRPKWLVDQSELLAQRGQREEALSAINEAISIYRPLADANPDAYMADLANALQAQAYRLAELRRLEEALSAINEAISIYRPLADANPDAYMADLANALQARAYRLADMGQLQEALSVISEAISIYEGLPDANPGAVLSARTSLAEWTGHAGDPVRARDLLAALVPYIERVYGSEHPDTLNVRSRLADWTGRAGDPAAAQRQLAMLLPDIERVYGPEAPQTLSARTGLADWTGQAGDSAGARDQLAALLPVLERVYGSEHPDTLRVRTGLASWTGQAGDPASARDQLAALLPVLERVYGPDGPQTLSARANLAHWTGEAGDPAGARDQFAALLPVLERVLGPDHPHTLSTRASLAHLIEEADEHSVASDERGRYAAEVINILRMGLRESWRLVTEAEALDYRFDALITGPGKAAKRIAVEVFYNPNFYGGELSRAISRAGEGNHPYINAALIVTSSDQAPGVTRLRDYFAVNKFPNRILQWIPGDSVDKLTGIRDQLIGELDAETSRPT